MRHLIAISLGLFCLAAPAIAKGLVDSVLNGGQTCFARDYAIDHLRSHPDQRVATIALGPNPDEAGITADGIAGMTLSLQLRDDTDFYTATAYCQDAGSGAICFVEGDGGSFSLGLAAGGAILLTVGPDGLSIEGAADFASLDPVKGDDKSFLLHPADVAACN